MVFLQPHHHSARNATKTLALRRPSPNHAASFTVPFSFNLHTTTTRTTTQPAAHVNVGVMGNASTSQRPRPRKNLRMLNQVEQVMRNTSTNWETMQKIQDCFILSLENMKKNHRGPGQRISPIQPIPCFWQLLRLHQAIAGALRWPPRCYRWGRPPVQKPGPRFPRTGYRRQLAHPPCESSAPHRTEVPEHPTNIGTSYPTEARVHHLAADHRRHDSGRNVLEIFREREHKRAALGSCGQSLATLRNANLLRGCIR